MCLGRQAKEILNSVTRRRRLVISVRWSDLYLCSANAPAVAGEPVPEIVTISNDQETLHGKYSIYVCCYLIVNWADDNLMGLFDFEPCGIRSSDMSGQEMQYC